MNSRNLADKLTVWMVLAAAVGLVMLATAPAAVAELDYHFTDFTPEFWVCTDANPCSWENPLLEGSDWFPTEYAGTTQAGANPEFTVMMKRKRNGCFNNSGEFVSNPACVSPNTLYIEQDLKSMTVSLPPGMMGDVNAAPYCELFWDWGANDGPGSTFSQGDQMNLWWCKNEDAVIGTADVLIQHCGPQMGNGDPGCYTSMMLPGSGVSLMLLNALVFNERPRTEGPYAGEQGHLVLLVPDSWTAALDPDSDSYDPDSWYKRPGGIAKVDISIRMRSDMTLEAVSEPIPATLDKTLRHGQDSGSLTPALWPFQVSDLVLTMNGRIGADKGHPLLTNPTFCDPQAFGAELVGYAENSKPIGWSGQGMIPEITQGTGIGESRSLSAPYTATGCDSIPYKPTFAASVDSDAPGAAAAFSTVITQNDFEATSKKIQVEFPKGMGININSTLKPCSAEDLAAKSCPEISKMGTVEAESRLLPKQEFLGDSVKKEDEVMRGNAYLTGIEGDKLTLSLLLEGYVDLRLDGTAGVGADGTLTATFDDLPSVPLNKFTLSLLGGDKGLLTNPKACGTHTTTATFTSHSGKVGTLESTSQVRGCSGPPEPEFEVDLSDNTKGKRTSVELDVSARERHIKKVTFGLPRYLKFSTKRLGKAKRFGRLAIETERGELESSLSLSQSVRAKRKKKKAIRFSSKGALNDLRVSLFKRKVGTKKVKIRTKSGKKKTVKRSVLKSRMSLKSLPKQDIKGLTVELNPSESRFLRNPKGCKKPLRFLAFVTTSDGKRHVLSQKVKLKGKGCSKKSKSKKK